MTFAVEGTAVVASVAGGGGLRPRRRSSGTSRRVASRGLSCRSRSRSRSRSCHPHSPVAAREKDRQECDRHVLLGRILFTISSWSYSSRHMTRTCSDYCCFCKVPVLLHQSRGNSLPYSITTAFRCFPTVL